jgi:hypothetical protein
MPAVANAVFDAVGVRVDEVPVTPEKILRGIEQKRRTDGQTDGRTEVRVGPERFPEVPWPEALIVPPPWEGGDGTAINQKRRTGTTATETRGQEAEAAKSVRASGKTPAAESVP